MSAHDVRKAKKNNRVPTHHAKIKQVSGPHKFPHPKNDENSDYLTEQDTASRTKCVGEAPTNGFTSKAPK